jgi:chromosome segregation ATPase
MQKFKKAESSSNSKLQEVKSQKDQINIRMLELEKQLKSTQQMNSKSEEKIKALEIEIETAHKHEEELQESANQLREEKDELKAELNRQTNAAGQSQDYLSCLQREFETLKLDITNSGEAAKDELKIAKHKIEEMTVEKSRTQNQLAELTKTKEKFEEKVKGLEEDLAVTNQKMLQSKKISEELEERNTKLMEALHYDVNNRAKKINKTHNQMKENSEQFSFRPSETQQESKQISSPPQSLIVESGDEVSVFESMHNQNSISKPKQQSPISEHREANKSGSSKSILS